MASNWVKAASTGVQRGQNGLKMGQNGSERTKMCSKEGQRGLKWAPHGSKCLQMASTCLKMGHNRRQRAPKASKWPPRPPNGLQGPHSPLSRQILPKSAAQRVPPALWEGWTWDWDPSAAASQGRFTISDQKCTSGTPLPYVNRVPPPSPMYIGYPPPLCT